MAHPDFVLPLMNEDAGFTVGGQVANLHDGIEQRLHISTLPEWTAYAEPEAPAEETLHRISRVAGVLALAAGVAATVAFLF